MQNKIVIIFTTIIITFASLVLSVGAEEGKIYLINIEYKNGEVIFGEVSARLGYAPPPIDESMASQDSLWIELVSFSGKILEKRLFALPTVISGSPPPPGDKTPQETIILEQTDYLVIMPYHKDGKTLKVYDFSKSFIAERDVGFLAQLCGDGTCQDHESYIDCPKDCPAAGKDDFCNQKYDDVDPDCPKVAAKICNNDGICAGNENIENCPSDCTLVNDVTTKEVKSNKTKIVVLSVVILIAVVVIILSYYFFIKKQKNNQ